MKDMDSEKSNVVLIGMPGCGKSTVGYLLAKKWNKRFIDVDYLIQKQTRQSLQEIINTKGVNYFNYLEGQTIKNINCRNSVISTGGSAILHFQGMQHLEKISRIVFLDVSLEIIKKRLWNLESRGIVLKPNQTIEDIFYERRPKYINFSSLIVDPGDTQAGVVTEMIDFSLRNYSVNRR